jgi:orotate phosphoribosyltransferase
MTDKLVDLEYLRNEIDHKGIYRCAPGTKIPGKIENTYYRWQFYLRRCMYDPKFVNVAAELLVDKLGSLEVQIGACEDAGVALGLAMAQKLKTPMFSIKKKPKEYGLKNVLEGPIIGLPVLLVDDVAGSQITLRNSRTLLQKLGIPVAPEYATLVNKTINTHDSYLHGMKLISLFTCNDFKMRWDDYINEYKRTPDFGIIY